MATKPPYPHVFDPKRLTVSVVVPCFNRETRARAAVQSVLDQDWPGARDPDRFCVIAVDDGSTDSTYEILSRIDDPRLRVVRNGGPKGACGARNFGAAATSSDWIAFQDSDDIWHPDKLSRQIAALTAADASTVAAYCAMAIVTDDGAPQGRVPDPTARGPLDGHILPALVWTSLISTQTLVVRRDAFDTAQAFDPEMPALQDWDLMLRVARLGAVAYTDSVLVDQHMSANSITRSSAKRLAAQERLMKTHADLWAEYPAAAAHHQYRIAGARRQTDDMPGARAALAAALALSPSNLRYRLMSVWIGLQMAAKRMRLGA